MDSKSLKAKFSEISQSREYEVFKNVSQVTLALLGFAGAVTVTVVLPGLVPVIGRMLVNKQRAEMRRIFIREKYDPLGREAKKYEHKSRDVLYYLRRRGFVSFDKNFKDATIELTKKGKKFLTGLKLTRTVVQKSAKWDGHWWVVLADIPTKTHRSQADMFRFRLKQIGFYALQRTVWIHPYDPTEALNNLTEYYDLGKFVTILQVSKLDSEDLRKLKKYFDL